MQIYGKPLQEGQLHVILRYQKKVSVKMPLLEGFGGKTTLYRTFDILRIVIIIYSLLLVPVYNKRHKAIVFIDQVHFAASVDALNFEV